MTIIITIISRSNSIAFARGTDIESDDRGCKVPVHGDSGPPPLSALSLSLSLSLLTYITRVFIRALGFLDPNSKTSFSSNGIPFGNMRLEL